jgi:proton-translocating NADH-quinone oxidoreductase chain L
MSDVSSYLIVIPALPLLAAVLIAFLGPKFLRELSHWPCILAVGASCVLSVFVFLAVYNAAPPAGHEAVAPAIKQYYQWFEAGSPGQQGYVNVGFTLRADALTALMLLTVTFISTLIAIYAAGYMHGDPGYPRFFAEVSLFVFAMTLLVLADNFLLLYAGWEGVGLCSYLLIGFWFEKPSAADAARKAFLVTRLGDVGLFLGIVLFWIASGFHLDMDGVFEHAGSMTHATLTVGCLLLLCGAVGKSAQFPLYVWLPDAMEGPTPVSALIHAATMVTAGVYLVARCTPLFALVPDVQAVVACIGGFTALLAALIALTQTDLKRVLAYSTISQLGYMFLAVGSGAVVAGMFHLFTHAFFKALLFMAAGSVMHAMGGVIDMRRFSGLRKLLPVTHITFLCGAAALAGFPFITSGFWSKDDILAGAWGRGGDHPIYQVLYWVGLATAGLTAFYTFRAYFLTFWGEERVPHEAGHHAHESPPVMTVPLAILAVGALVVGFVNAEPFTDALGHFLYKTGHLATAFHPEATPYALLWTLSSLMALGGIGVAWWMYVREPGLAARLAARFPVLYQASRDKFYVDEIYDRMIVQPLLGFARGCRILDLHVVDSLVDLVGQIPQLFGALFQPVQNGLVQFYALAMVLGLTVFLLALARAL